MFRCFPRKNIQVDHNILIVNSVVKSSKETKKNQKRNFEHDDVLLSFMTIIETNYNMKPSKTQQKTNKFFYKQLKRISESNTVITKHDDISLVNQLKGIKIPLDNEITRTNYRFKGEINVRELYDKYTADINGIILLVDTRNTIGANYSLSVLRETLKAFIYNWRKEKEEDDDMCNPFSLMLVMVEFHPDDRKKFYSSDDNKFYYETIDVKTKLLTTIPTSDDRLSRTQIYKKLELNKLEAKFKFIDIYWEPFIFQNKMNRHGMKKNRSTVNSIVYAMMKHISNK